MEWKEFVLFPTVSKSRKHFAVEVPGNDLYSNNSAAHTEGVHILSNVGEQLSWVTHLYPSLTFSPAEETPAPNNGGLLSVSNKISNQKLFT